MEKLTAEQVTSALKVSGTMGKARPELLALRRLGVGEGLKFTSGHNASGACKIAQRIHVANMAKTDSREWRGFHTDSHCFVERMS
jgi:hypothetical protein